jgi:hypothetical protein
MKKIIITLLSIFFLNLMSHSQNNKFTIVVLKGSGFIEYSKLKVVLNKSYKYNINELGFITLLPNSSAIVFNEKLNLELNGIEIQRFSTKEIYSKLKNVKSNSQTVNFINYLNKIYEEIENNKNSFGATLGGASRSILNEEYKFYPPDETILLSNKFVLKFGNKETKLKSNIIVFNESNYDTVFNEFPKTNNVLLNDLKPGNYSWSYEIQSNGQNLNFKNTFIVPNKSEKNKIINEVLNFKKKLDYLEKNLNLSKISSEQIYNDFLIKSKYIL